MADLSPVFAPAAPEGASVNLACFAVQGQIYALEVEHLREIVRAQAITPLPDGPALIEGVVDLRGAVIPVVDLARCLGLASSEHSSRSRIVIVEYAGLALGLGVDAATDVIALASERLEAVPALATRAGYRSVTHIVRREGEPPVMLISLESLVETVAGSSTKPRGGAGGSR